MISVEIENIWGFIPQRRWFETVFKRVENGKISCEDILRLINNLVKLFMLDGCLWMLIDS